MSTHVIPRCRASLCALAMLCIFPAAASRLDSQELEDIEGIIEIVPVPVLAEADGQAEEIIVIDESAIPEEWVAERSGFEIYGIDHPLTKKFRETMLSPLRQKWLAAVLERGAEYRPYIRLQLEQREMPAFIEFLPIVESEFSLTARSASGATGMWQFMANSMAPYLKKSTYIDERYDPWKSTDAALSKLQDNYRRFGDWLIALAAYNCGAGAMERVLAKYPDKDFWYLAENNLLKQQTIQYIPKLLAISDIIMNKDLYQLELPDLDEHWRENAELSFDYITMEASVNLSTLAAKAEIPLAELEHLNPELIQKRTPYGKYKVRIRAGTKDAVLEALKNNGAVTKIDYSQYERHMVVKGDTLYALARKHNTTVGDLQLINNLGSSSKIFIGQSILLPILK